MATTDPEPQSPGSEGERRSKSTTFEEKTPRWQQGTAQHSTNRKRTLGYGFLFSFQQKNRKKKGISKWRIWEKYNKNTSRDTFQTSWRDPFIRSTGKSGGLVQCFITELQGKTTETANLGRNLENTVIPNVNKLTHDIKLSSLKTFGI